MLMDGQLLLSNAQAVTTTAVSTNVFDSGSLRDLGNGDDPTLDILCVVTTTFAGGTSILATLQGSIDNSTFFTMTEGPVVVLANLIQGQRLLDQTLPRPLQGAITGAPLQANPRYYRMNYTVVGTMTLGNLSAFIVLDRQTAQYYAPGIVIAS